jgi:hypothetical protein
MKSFPLGRVVVELKRLPQGGACNQRHGAPHKSSLLALEKLSKKSFLLLNPWPTHEKLFAN